jgi:hypothetical protein
MSRIVLCEKRIKRGIQWLLSCGLRLRGPFGLLGCLLPAFCERGNDAGRCSSLGTQAITNACVKLDLGFWCPRKVAKLPCRSKKERRLFTVNKDGSIECVF